MDYTEYLLIYGVVAFFAHITTKLISILLVILLMLRKVFNIDNKKHYNKVLTKSWLFGILSDIITFFVLVVFKKINFISPEFFDSFFIAIIISAILTFVFDYFIVFRKTILSNMQKFILSITLTVFTVSYCGWYLKDILGGDIYSLFSYLA